MNSASRLSFVLDCDPLVHSFLSTKFVEWDDYTTEYIMLIDIFVEYHKSHLIIDSLDVQVEVLVPLGLFVRLFNSLLLRANANV